MEPQYLWWVLAIGLVVAELFTGTFFLLILAIGAVLGGIAAWFAFPIWVQLLVAAVGCAIGWALLHSRRKNRDASLPAQSNPNVVLDVGGTVDIDQWSQGRQTQVRYRGAMWTAELADTVQGAGQAGAYTIKQVRGSTLVVVPQ
jgi:membrane protein implicated in regulation of membrane protease activity